MVKDYTFVSLEGITYRLRTGTPVCWRRFERKVRCRKVVF
jgi:hypothetical protein